MRIPFLLLGLLLPACAPAAPPESPAPTVEIQTEAPAPTTRDGDRAEGGDETAAASAAKNADTLAAYGEYQGAGRGVGGPDSGGHGGLGDGVGTSGLGGLGTKGQGSGVVGHQPRPAKVPGTARVEEPTVQGALPPAVVHLMLVKQKARFRSCYERRLSSDPAIAGRLSISFQIDGSGSVTSAKVDSSVEHHLDECVRNVVEATAFPGLDQGTVSVKAAITFSPSTTSTRARLPRAAIRQVMVGAAGRIKLCYQQELAKDPDLKGKLVVKLTIVSDGSVSQVSLARTFQPAVDACVLSVMRGLQFPAPRGGIVNVTYPFVFASAP